MGIGKIVRHSSLYLIGTIASRAVGFLLVPLYAHYLSPVEYGMVDLIDLMVTIAALCVGVSAAGTAMVRMYHEKPDEGHRKRVVSTTLILVVLTTVPLCIGGMFASRPLSRLLFHSEANAGIIMAFFAAMFFGNIGEILSVLMRMRDRVILIVSYALVCLVAAASLNIFFIAFQRRGIWGFVLSKLIVGSGGALFLLVIGLRYARLNFDRAYARKLIAFGAPLVVSGLAFFTLHFSDRFFLNAYGYRTQLGQYALGYRFAFMLPVLIAEPFSRAWGVSFYQLAEGPAWKLSFVRILRHLLFLMILGATGLSLFSRPALQIMVTDAYRPALYVIPIVAFAYVFRQAGDFFRDLLLISKRSGLIGKMTCGTAIFNIALNFAWIPHYGMYGAAWATVASWGAYMLIFWVAAYREHQFPFPLRSLGSGLALAMLTLYGAAATTPRAFWGGVAASSAWMLVFLLAIWKSGYFPMSDLAEIGDRVVGLRHNTVAWIRRRQALGREKSLDATR